MTKNPIIYWNRKGDGIDAVIGTAVFPVPKKQLWERANHPYKFAPHCINLEDFTTEEDLKAGNKIEEIHSFLGWKQKYTGAVKSAINEKLWSMHTYPVGWGPFPLPHFVEYSFNDISANKSQLTIHANTKQEVFCLCRLPAMLSAKSCKGLSVNYLLFRKYLQCKRYYIINNL